ncbi:N-6 DNA methylase [Bengtsoniella intestinalis]|uniref:N-6 DNA methylase n=1 Tax=Bengtsoniella intestinalis TaxID=3073143 RepID=UPI00391FC057
MGKVTHQLRNENQKNITRIFDRLSQRNSRWTVWSDFVVMSAISISNTVDKVNEQSREQLYMDTIKKYTKAELLEFAQMIAELVMGMERNPNCDFLGELFMMLELSNAQNGQFFTPYSVCSAMAKLTIMDELHSKIETEGWVSVNDCACGAGALLIAFANECKEQNINYQRSVLFVAQDLDYTAAMMCYLQLSLMGCPGYVVVANTITNPVTTYDRKGLLPRDGQNIWYTPFYFTEIWQGRTICASIDRMFHQMPKPAPAEVKEEQQEITVTQSTKTDYPINETKAGQLTLF